MSQFQIRRHRLEDVDELFAAAIESREHVSKWMGWITTDYSRKDTRKWIEDSLDGWDRGDSYEHLIVDADEIIVGACGLNSVNHKDRVCNLGYWIRASRIGEGAALEGTLLIRDFGFQQLGLNRLEIVVAVGNEYSRKVAERVGAHYEGIQRARLMVDGMASDAHMYALINASSERTP